MDWSCGQGLWDFDLELMARVDVEVGQVEVCAESMGLGVALVPPPRVFCLVYACVTGDT